MTNPCSDLPITTSGDSPGPGARRADVDRLLKDAASRPADNELSISIRDFIGYWDAQRRGSWVVERIQAALDRHELTTVPSFENGWFDNTIVLRLKSRAQSDAA